MPILEFERKGAKGCFSESGFFSWVSFRLKQRSLSAKKPKVVNFLIVIKSEET